MATLGRLLIDIAANTSQLKTDLNEARREIGTFRGSVEGMAGSVTRLGGNILKLAAGAITFRMLSQAAAAAVQSFAETERQSLRLNAVIRATGNAAGISAKEFRQLASELEGTSLFDEDAILAAISQLQTFDNISGQTFRNAIRLSVDLASLWDGDVSAAAFGLGKALQDPAEAASLLSRAKVRLTEEEKKAIDAFLKLNDVAGAQGVIFRALEERVGGAATGEASGLSGSFHRLREKIDDARKALVGFFVGSKDAIGLADAIQRSLTPSPSAGAVAPLAKVPDLNAFTNTKGISEEVGGLTALVGLGRANAADIARLREIGRAHAEAVRLPNQEYEVRLRLWRELKQIQEALKSLEKPVFNNLGALGDSSRMGATPEQEATMRAAIANSRLSSAMTGVGGTRGTSPFNEQRIKDAAELWRQTWTNAIEDIQDSFADFFSSIGEEGFKLVDVFRNIAKAIQRTFAEVLSRQLVNAIFNGFLNNVSGPGGATLGNQTQSGGGMSQSVVHVHMNNAMHISAMDGADVQRVVDRHGQVFVGKMMQGFADAPALARFVVAQGSR